ncbi:ATP-dependent RNA helicase DDX24 [Rhinatrema bivittatum]|uniref:ATP-dependent RNA helicase DDX24 n=1 Tax=Rhinatrema bivittatum TaxID=194408 RepID=UPI00112D4F22|nr:ATP-dependent RNA helicase DDX24 [Rhinatrema bivittatum]XP_029453726.1 ATP-dependent RNA helicase DDX24 [Rhinatrema bivittatum]
MKISKGKRPLKPSAKFQRKGIKVTGKWKPVEVDLSLFADEQFDKLVCFEELTDYQLVNAANVVQSKGIKRKPVPADEDRDGGEQEEELARGRKRKKKNGARSELKKRKRPALQVEQGDTPEDNEDSVEGKAPETWAEEPEATETMADQKRSQKKKKRKAKKRALPSQEGAPLPKASKKGRNWTTGALDSADHNTDVSAWRDLFVPKPVLQALSHLGFSAPTPIQALALPSAIRDDLDILGAAETGSGKTLAFAIPIIHSILKWQKTRDVSRGQEVAPGSAEEEEPENGSADPAPSFCRRGEDESEEWPPPGCLKGLESSPAAVQALSAIQSRPLLGLIVTPTRELAVQVKHHIDAVARFTGIKTAIVVGGMAPQKQQRVLNRRPEIVIATPGRLWELIREKHPHLCNLRQLRCLVIDEADRMVERGHFLELTQLLELLSDAQFNPKRQTFVFSATLTLVHQAPMRVLKKKNAKKMDKATKLDELMQKIGMRGKPKVIDLTRKEATVETLTETRIHCERDEKDLYLYYFLLQYPGRTMVFANSIDCIKRLHGLLTILDCSPLPLHANMHQKQRLKNLERFAERESCVLLTTDVAARGLDIPRVQHVIHYQVPRTSETYVHRSGRTARATSEGLSLLLIGPDDVMNFKKISRTLGKNEELPVFPVDTKCMTSIKERVNVARQIEKVEYQKSKAQQHNAWFQQAAEALELELEDDVLIGGQDEEEQREKQKILKGLKRQLKYLLTQPLFKNLMNTKYPTQDGRLPIPIVPVGKANSALSTVTKLKQMKQGARAKSH